MKRNNTCEIKSETHSSSLYIEITHDVCKWLQNQKIYNTKYINIKVYQTNSPPKLVTSKIFFPLKISFPPKSNTPFEERHSIPKFLPLFDTIVKWHKMPKDLTGGRQKIDIEGIRRTRNHRPTRKRKTRCCGHKGKKMQNKEKWNACKGISINQEVSRIYREEANLNGSRSYRVFIEETETFSMDQEVVEKLSWLQ